jgi:hypothetical protein
MLPCTVPVEFLGFTPFVYCIVFLSFTSFARIRSCPLSKEEKKLLSFFALYFLVYLCLLPLGYKMDFENQIFDIKSTIQEFLFPFVIICLLKKKEDSFSIFKIFLVLSLILCLYDFYCVYSCDNPYYTYMRIRFGGDDVSGAFAEEQRGGLDGRFGSFVGHPLYYSVSALILCFINYIGYLRNQISLSWKILYWIVFVLLPISIFFSGSRSSLIALIIGLSFFLFRKNGFLKCFFILSCGYFLLLGSNTMKIWGKYEPFVNSVVYFWSDESSSDADIKGSSKEMRMDQMKATFSEIKGPALFFGNGAGWPWYYTKIHGTHPILFGFESIFFSGFIEFGFIGFFLIYVLLFISFFRFSFKINGNTGIMIQSFLVSYVAVSILTSPYFFIVFLGSVAFIFKSIRLK